MPFKHKRTQYYQIRRQNLPGYGPFGRISTRVTSKAIALQMKRLMRRIAERGLEEPSWHRLLDALRDKELTLPDLLKAKNEGHLDALRIMVQDPLLSVAIDEYLQTDPGYDTENGLRILQLMAEREFGPRVRFGLLRSGKNLTKLCARARREGGRPSKEHPLGRPVAHNSVRRTLLLSASKLIRFHLGSAERDAIFADVDFARRDDTRDVWLDAEEFARLVEASEPWFRPVIMTATLTGADRSPLLRLRVRDVEIIYDRAAGSFSGQIYLRDSKTDARPRSVAIIDTLCRALLPLCKGKAPDDPVFDGPPVDRFGKPRRRTPLNAAQVRYWFENAREKAGLAHVRWKDLRRTWAVNADKAGLNLGQMKSGLGHARSETTVGYTNRQVTLGLTEAERVARQLGVGAPSASREGLESGEGSTATG